MKKLTLEGTCRCLLNLLLAPFLLQVVSAQNHIVVKWGQNTGTEIGNVLEKYGGAKVTNLPGNAEVWKVTNGIGVALKDLNGQRGIRFAEPFLGNAKELFS